MSTSSYFAQYDFMPNAQLGIHKQFKSLAKAQGWQKDSKKYREEQVKMIDDEFYGHFAALKITSLLEQYQSLCGELGIVDIPRSVTACKKCLGSINVSIVDLLDVRRRNQAKLDPQEKEFPRVFVSLNKFRRYIRNDKSKIYPKEYAKRDGVLSTLLRRVF